MFKLYQFECCQECDRGYFLGEFKTADEVIAYIGVDNIVPDSFFLESENVTHFRTKGEIWEERFMVVQV